MSPSHVACRRQFYYLSTRRTRPIKVSWPQAKRLPSSVRANVPHQSRIAWLLFTRNYVLLKGILAEIRSRFNDWEQRVQSA